MDGIGMGGSGMERLMLRSPEELEALFAESPAPADERLGEVLVGRLRLLDERQLTAALERQRRLGGGVRLGRLLIEMGLLDRAGLTIALAHRLGIPYVGLEFFEIPLSALSRIPAELAFRHQVVPLAVLDAGLVVALSDPLADDVLEVLRFHTGVHPLVVLAPQRDILLALSTYYSQFDEDQALEEARLGPGSEAPPAVDAGRPERIELEARKRPIVRLLNAIVTHALVAGASDINIRPEADSIDVYYRIDGHLHFFRRFDKGLLAALVSRVKILGRMDIAERRLPQEGNARLLRGEQRVDLRLSVMPTIAGESVVIRLLDEAVGLRPLADLGLPGDVLAHLLDLLERPHGLVLVTGPTGSGKTTTLYALINALRSRRPHILTIEDPVEYRMPGVEQVQVDEQIGVGFASTLRRFMRHDPDVVMIGEIRDRETAEIAIQAALTGHLVLSTLHTNDAPGAVERLVDMGIEPYLVTATLLGVLAQRLVRLNCRACAVSSVPGGDELMRLPERVRGRLEGRPLMRGRGCADCRHSGCFGRALVAEFMRAGPAVAEEAGGAGRRGLRERCRRDGWRPLADHALEMLLAGRTSLDEIRPLLLEGA